MEVRPPAQQYETVAVMFKEQKREKDKNAIENQERNIGN
jgi:hypothetical protein